MLGKMLSVFLEVRPISAFCRGQIGGLLQSRRVLRSIPLLLYTSPEEVMKLNDIAEMRAGATLGTALQSEYMTVSGACFINQRDVYKRQAENRPAL